MLKGAGIDLAAALMVFASLVIAHPAHAQAYKCKDAKGRVTYSDAPCLGQDTSVVSTSGNAVDASADRARAAQSEATSAARSSASAGGGMTAQQREDRLRELEIETKRMGNSPQQRTAAKREIEALRRGSAEQLSPQERERREDLYKDAGRADTATRQKAGRELKEQTDKYESPEYLRQRELELQRTREQVGTIASCDPGGCNDTLGRRYNKGAGPTFIRTDGRACQQVGNQLHCN